MNHILNVGKFEEAILENQELKLKLAALEKENSSSHV